MCDPRCWTRRFFEPTASKHVVCCAGDSSMQRLQAHKFQSRRNATDCHKDVGSNYRQVHCPATICSGLHIKQPPVREAVHPPHRVSLLLQTCAGKGKGKQGMRQGMGSQRTGPQMPPTPAVDPENVEFVLFVQNPKVSPQFMSFCSITLSCQGLEQPE